MKIIEDIRHPKMPLTAGDIEEMEPETIFAHGYAEILHPWFNNISVLRALGHGYLNVEGTGETASALQVPESKYRLVKWVAMRGQIPDWKIYHSMDANLCQEDYFDCDCHLLATWHQIAHHGAGLHGDEEIRRLIPCTDEAFKLYRH